MLNLGYWLDIQGKPSTRKMEIELQFTGESNGDSDAALRLIPREMIVEAKAPVQLLKEIVR